MLLFRRVPGSLRTAASGGVFKRLRNQPWLADSSRLCYSVSWIGTANVLETSPENQTGIT